MRAVTFDARRPRLAPPAWQNGPAGSPEENPWMQKEDVASAWAVFALTGAAVALLVVLAILG